MLLIFLTLQLMGFFKNFVFFTLCKNEEKLTHLTLESKRCYLPCIWQTNSAEAPTYKGVFFFFFFAEVVVHIVELGHCSTHSDVHIHSLDTFAHMCMHTNAHAPSWTLTCADYTACSQTLMLSTQTLDFIIFNIPRTPSCHKTFFFSVDAGTVCVHAHTRKHLPGQRLCKGRGQHLDVVCLLGKIYIYIIFYSFVS